MFSSSKRPGYDLALRHRNSMTTIVMRAMAKAGYRYRRQLAPIYAAPAVLAAGTGSLVLHSTTGPGWYAATYAVGTVCAGAWLTRLKGYDRAYAAVVTATVEGWTLWMAYDPADPTLYGLWALATPVLGLGWWLSGTLRAQLRADAVRNRWQTVAKLAGIAGARLVATRRTAAGEVLTVRLDSTQTVRDINRERLEAAYELRPGAVKVEPDATNSRRVILHITETDPWSGDLTHPAVAAALASVA